MNNAKDIVRIAVAVLGGLKLFLAAFGIEIPQDIIDIAVDIVSGAVVIWGFVQHNFLGPKGRQQKNVLEKNGLL